MKIVLAPEGTEGDIRPILALGLGLRDAGHNVEACVPPDFIEYFTRHGIPSHPMAIPVKTFMAMHGAMMAGRTIKTFKPMLDNFKIVVDGQFSALEQYGRKADFIIGAGLQFAGSSIAEKFGITFRHALHVPVVAPSAFYPPPITRHCNLPRFVNKALWALYVIPMNLLLKKSINRRRAGFGLPPVNNIISFFMRNMLLAMDSELATWPPDIHQPSLSQTAYWQLSDQSELDAPLRKFIEQGSPPIYIGFGSMADPKPHRTIAIIRKAINQLGIRAVVSRGWIDRTDMPIGDDALFFAGHSPHLKLFPYMAAVVHHAGAGTTHTATLCGVPQVTVPHILDQYYWGNRVHSLGLGPKPLNCRRFTPVQLARAIEQAVGNPRYKENAMRLETELKQHDGVAEAVKLLGG